MDHFHCARCGHWPKFAGGNNQRYYLTSCYHLFCESCCRGSPQQCIVCQRACSYKELSGQVGNDVKDLFTDPTTLIRSACQQIPKALQVLEFQKYLQKDSVRIVGKLMETCKSLKEENDRLKLVNGEFNSRLEQKDKIIKDLETQIANRPIANNSSTGSSDPLGLFRDSVERPNAVVSPQIASAGGNRNDSPISFSLSRRSSVISLGHSTGSRAPNQPLYRQYNYSNTPLSISTPSLQLSTPRSSFSQAPFLSGFPSQSPVQITPTQLQHENSNSRTPELINRLRSLRCKSTPLSGGNHHHSRF